MDKVETLTMTRCETMLAMANMLATQMDVDPWVVIAISKLWTSCMWTLQNFGIHNQQKWNVWTLGEIVVFVFLSNGFETTIMG